MDCIFCKIASKAIPSKILFEDEHVVAFPDLRPVAPTHVLVIPKKHIARVDEATADDALVMGHVLLGAKAVAAALGLGERGFRVVLNTGEDAGQSVFHVHAHVLAGRSLAWPPG